MIQFSHSVVSDSLWPHELQHARPPCPSPTPGVHPNSCPSSSWCHPAISSSVVPFSSCPQSLPASGSFPVSQLFTSGGQSIGVSALASVLPKNTEDWSPLEWTGWISLQSKGLSRVFSNTIVQKHQFFGTQLSSVQFSHPYMTTGKTIALTRWTFVGKVMSLLLNILSRLVITFLPRSKLLLISFLAAFQIFSLKFSILILKCLGVGYFGFILFGVLCDFWTWIFVSFFSLGKFSATFFGAAHDLCDLSSPTRDLTWAT